jgi:NADH:ubiquinone oxidoreductase subunit H
MVFAARLLGKRFRYYTYASIVVILVFGIWTSFQIPQMAANEPTPWMGLKERINIYAIMLWVAVLALGLLRAQRVPSHETGMLE